MLTDIVATIKDKRWKERLDERCLKYLREHEVPESLVEILEACAYEGELRVGPISLLRFAQVDDANAGGENARCIEHGLLIVGYGANGDLVVVQLSSNLMGFVSHDDLWEGDFTEFSECVVMSPLHFDEFWTAASTDDEFPADCHDAESRWPTSPGSTG